MHYVGRDGAGDGSCCRPVLVVVMLRNVPVAKPKILDLLREVLGRVVGCNVHW